MAQFGTDYGVMEEKARSLASLADDYASIGRQLRSEATSIGAAYDSADGRTYVRRIEEACTDLDHMASELGKKAEILASQAQGYRRTESDNAGDAEHLPI